jgi:Transposase DNA-binding
MVTRDCGAWAEEQFGTCEFKDQRRTARRVKFAEQVAQKPDASTPTQTEEWSVGRRFGTGDQCVKTREGTALGERTAAISRIILLVYDGLNLLQ